MPRLLSNSELVSGDCNYFVEKRCYHKSSNCPSDFNLCMPVFEERLFHLHLTKKSLDDQIIYCKGRSGELAEFPGRLEDAVRSYFPLFKALLKHRFVDLSSCDTFGPNNIQCHVAIGARRQNGIYKWIRNGSPIQNNFSVPNVVIIFKRNRFDNICFNVLTNISLHILNTGLKDQRTTWHMLGICECFL